MVAENVTYDCKVLDMVTKRPIEGVAVTVLRRVSSPGVAFDKWPNLGETKHRTDAEGRFTFTVPPEQAEIKDLNIGIKAHEPNYLHFSGGYSFHNIRKNEWLGDRPFFETIKLKPAEQLMGAVVKPDGSPAADVLVLGYSLFDPDDINRFEWTKTETNRDGVFRLNVILGGQTIFWLVPKDYSPSTQFADRDLTHLLKSGDKWIVDTANLPAKHEIQQYHRDLGRFVLKKGIRLHGHVLDEAGRPVPGIWINACNERSQAMKYINFPFADSIRRSALTDVDGRFELQPLPAGKYCVAPFDEPEDPIVEDKTPRPLPVVFLQQTIALKKYFKTKEVEFRAVPTVNIAVQYYDSAGKPCSGFDIWLSGQLDHRIFCKKCPADSNGRIAFQAPKGLTGIRLQFHGNELRTLRGRVSKDAPLSNSQFVELGTLTQDMTDIAVISYMMPILLVRAVDESGKMVEGFQAKIKYLSGQATREGEFVREGKPAGNVYIEQQDDGRWRTYGLLPDEEFTLSVEAPGYRPSSQKLNLPEGSIKELDVKLQKE